MIPGEIRSEIPPEMTATQYSSFLNEESRHIRQTHLVKKHTAFHLPLMLLHHCIPQTPLCLSLPGGSERKRPELILLFPSFASTHLNPLFYPIWCPRIPLQVTWNQPVVIAVVCMNPPSCLVSEQHWNDQRAVYYDACLLSRLVDTCTWLITAALHPLAMLGQSHKDDAL